MDLDPKGANNQIKEAIDKRYVTDEEEAGAGSLIEVFSWTVIVAQFQKCYFSWAAKYFSYFSEIIPIFNLHYSDQSHIILFLKIARKILNFKNLSAHS